VRKNRNETVGLDGITELIGASAAEFRSAPEPLAFGLVLGAELGRTYPELVPTMIEEVFERASLPDPRPFVDRLVQLRKRSERQARAREQVSASSRVRERLEQVAPLRRSVTWSSVGWMKRILFTAGAEGDQIRARAMPALQRGLGPDPVGLGPDSPVDHSARQHLFGHSDAVARCTVSVPFARLQQLVEFTIEFIIPLTDNGVGQSLDLLPRSGRQSGEPI
jgi:hypothetical protein